MSPRPLKSCTQFVHARPEVAATARLIRRIPHHTGRIIKKLGARMIAGMPREIQGLGVTVALRTAGIWFAIAPKTTVTVGPENHHHSRRTAGGTGARLLLLVFVIGTV